MCRGVILTSKSTAAVDSVTLQADPRSAGAARRHVRAALEQVGLAGLVDTAALAVSEIVTNALVHAGSEVELRTFASERSIRVEVEDRSATLPSRRSYAEASGTGRGLNIVQDSVTHWGTTALADGKIVWFEVSLSDEPSHGETVVEAASATGAAPGVVVLLHQVPLLMHRAWQEHAALLLREYLLLMLGERDDIMDLHAQASEAMSLLHAHIPVPDPGEDPTALMSNAFEPKVTAEQVLVHVPVESVPHFVVLDSLLSEALDEARSGRLMSPPTQPEIRQMQQWICTEVSRQATHHLAGTPWHTEPEAQRTKAALSGRSGDYTGLADADQAVVVSDETSVIVAVSPPALDLLGYPTSDDLVGRRVISVVPPRFRQAHIAGTTLHAINGRDPLLGTAVRVPMLRRDGTEVVVELTVELQRLPVGRAYVARFHAA